MEAASSRSSTSLEGVWHQAVRTDWAWKYGLLMFVIFNIVWNIAEPLRIQYYASHNIIYESDYPLSILAVAIITMTLAILGAYWADRNKISAMLRFDDAGIAIRLKSGLVIEAGWNLVKGVQLQSWGDVTSIRLSGMFLPSSGQFPPDVGRALVARVSRMRRSRPEPAEPEEPTLEDVVDQRLAARNRM